jgi:hypothetical protein
MQVVSNLKGKTIGQFVSQNILEGSIISNDGYHSYRKPLAEKWLQMYLYEYCYRFNRRFFRGELFSRLLCAVASSTELEFAEQTQ